MKTTKNILALLIITLALGCTEPVDPNTFNREFFPTNHWKVVGQGADGKVVVETTSTNIAEYLRVHEAMPVGGSLTNGAPVRVQLTLRRQSLDGTLKLISSKAYPAME